MYLLTEMLRGFQDELSGVVSMVALFAGTFTRWFMGYSSFGNPKATEIRDRWCSGHVDGFGSAYLVKEMLQTLFRYFVDLRAGRCIIIVADVVVDLLGFCCRLVDSC